MKARMAIWGAMFLSLITTSAAGAAEVARSSMQLSVTVVDSREDVWSSPLAAQLPTMMVIVGSFFIALSVKSPSSWIRRSGSRTLKWARVALVYHQQQFA